jgi:uncharacterized protein
MLEKIVAFCVRRPWLIVILTLGLSGAGAYVTTTRFAIDTDTDHLFAPEIPWRHNEAALFAAFPHLSDLIVAVLDAPTPEAAESAAKRLHGALQNKPLLSRVWLPDDHPFFHANGLLYLSLDDVRRTTATLIAQKEILQPLAEDPTLRGLSDAMLANLKMVGGSERGMARYTAGLDEFSNAFESALAGKSARVSWEKLLSAGQPTQPDPTPANAAPPDTRRIVLIKPVIDYSALQPGADAIALVRDAAKDLKFAGEGVKMRLTGQVPLADDEFATISENMEVNLSATLAVVTLILFAALRSPKLILAVLATLIAGLAMTSGLGIALIGRFNLISVAFAALFIGLGVDFGVQFAMRYREERHKSDDLPVALAAAARGIGVSLSLAAIALVAGFFCFLPTDFRGVAELGLIAGLGMIIAYVATLTFLPALIRLMRPGAEKRPVETASLAKIDHWIAGHRAVVLTLTAAVLFAGAPFLRHLSFDSNPMNLRDQKVESVATFLDLSKDPRTAPNTIEITAHSLEEMRDLAAKVAALPEVDHVTTIDTLIPTEQDAKLPLVENARYQLRNVFDPKRKAAPTDAELVKLLPAAAKALRKAGGKTPPPALARFAATLDALAAAPAATREAAQHAAFDDFHRLLAEAKGALGAARVTPETLPADLAGDWISRGLYRIEASPKGDGNDREVMTKFAAAVTTFAPDASGPPIAVAEAGATIVRAFVIAGVYAFVAIFAILVFALRRATDVALTLGPLLLAGIASLEASDALGLSLNFANIIALPLMFAVGVAFHIYYVIAWRKGIVDMLASSLTRAIFFSALTTGTAFGSLFFSSHPGTASMGELLAISLLFTLLAAFVVVPAFLGPPPTPPETGAP